MNRYWRRRLGVGVAASAVVLAFGCSPDTKDVATSPDIMDDVECDAFETREKICVHGQTGQRVASIGGTPVPGHLQCQEDEVIGFDGVPDTLVCLHIDDLIIDRPITDPKSGADFIHNCGVVLAPDWQKFETCVNAVFDALAEGPEDGW